jgi:hypothetical protein
MKNLMQAYNLVKKYGHVIGMVVELLVIVEESGKDKKLTKQERSKIMKKLWQIVNTNL